MELASAFAIETWAGLISRKDAELDALHFRSDIVAGKLQICSIAEPKFAIADTLAERHAFSQRLRALDALQPVVAFELRCHGLVDHVVAADLALCEVANRKTLGHKSGATLSARYSLLK
jgi:hypothetical protein